jgi:hypothetical protein
MAEEAPSNGAEQVRHGPIVESLRGMSEMEVAHILLNPANDFWANKVNRPPVSTICC